MTDPASSPWELQRKRELFLGGEDRAAEGVPAHIRRSWSRCVGLPEDPRDADPLAGGALLERRERAERLLAAALPELDALSEHACGNGCVAVLADPTGLILEEMGGALFLAKAQRLALLPGVDWSEGHRGTNAIGTALAERDALVVLGAEHYLPQNAAIGCVAAPIFDGRGEIAGVLDISGENARVDRQVLGLVRLAAQQVEHRLVLAEARGELLRFHTQPELLGSAREGLLVVEQGCIVGANRVALALLGRRRHELVGQPADGLMRQWQVSRAGPAREGEQRRVGAGGATPLALRIERLPSPRASVAALPAAVAATATQAAPSESVADPLDALLRDAVKVLNHGLSLLVTGETGSGKEVFVQRLHRASRRSGGPLVAVNCAALPETLIEAELFGHEEGAFTGARRHGSPGRLRDAHGGLLFLDEIADMPLALQTRLLRVLEERKVTPLGGRQASVVDFDLVCATHGDLPALAARGAFRSDLMYRVAGYSVALPALRERPDRGALMARLFEQAGAGAKQLRLDPAAWRLLEGYAWPGNVRELVSVLRAIVAVAEVGEVIDASRLPMAVRGGASDGTGRPLHDPHPPTPDGPATRLADLERNAISSALADAAGNVAEASRRLGLHRSTVYRHLAQQRLAAGGRGVPISSSP